MLAALIPGDRKKGKPFAGDVRGKSWKTRVTLSACNSN